MNLDLISVCAHGAGALGGMGLFVGPFTAKGKRAPQWIRVSLWMSGIIALLWCGLGLAMHEIWLRPSAHVRALLKQYHTLAAGMGMGILILMLTSGEFFAAFRKPR